MRARGPNPPAGLPAAEIAIDPALARALLAAQHPDLAGLPLSPFAEGWDNVTLRLGSDLLMRMPRRAAAAPLIENEQAWLPRLAPHLPLPIPVPVRVGVAQGPYPWRWSIVPLLPGAPLDEAPLADEAGAQLGAFLRALHAMPAGGAPANLAREGPLTDHDRAFMQRAARLAAAGRLPSWAEPMWRRALALPVDRSRVLLHGDLHPLNAIGASGRLTAILDWGDVCAGDPAMDLAAFWMLAPSAAARESAFAAYGGASDATRARARAWALYVGVVLLDSGLINSPRHARFGEAVLARLAS